MAKKNANLVKNGKSNIKKAVPRSIAHFTGGIRHSGDYIAASVAVCADLLEGTISAAVGNAVRGHTTNILKVEELRFKYCKGAVDSKKTLELSAS